MIDQELEEVLRRALRSAHPGEGFAERVLARLRAGTAEQAQGPAAAAARTPPVSSVPVLRHARGRVLSRWAPLTLAACAVAGMGLARWRHEALQWQRGLQAREQLLQALSIAGANVNAVRTAVITAEQPMP